MGYRKISSVQNPRVKAASRLHKRRDRDRLGLMLIEGAREVSRALVAGVEIVEVFFCPESATGRLEGDLLEAIEGRGVPVTAVDRSVMARIAYREGTDPIVAVARKTEHTLDMLPATAPALFLVIDGVEKPGNLGAMLRTADAAGVSGIIVSDPGTDLCNPNVVRASLGTVFTVPAAVAAVDEAVRWLRDRGMAIVTSSPDGEMPYTAADLAAPCAIVVGSEELGAGEEWFEASDIVVRIPMLGAADSLNVSASAAILVYEALRQRTEREAGGDGPGGR